VTQSGRSPKLTKEQLKPISWRPTLNSDKLNRWLTLGANIAVLVGLAALVLEIRTNTAAIYANSIQEITTGTRETLLTVASDKELSRIVRIGAVDRSALDEDDAFRFALFSRQRWLFFQGIWTQRRLGVLDDQGWGAYERVICTELLIRRGNREEWPNHAGILDPEFVRVVEACSN
jgi:hypothetical protein